MKFLNVDECAVFKRDRGLKIQTTDYGNPKFPHPCSENPNKN